MWKIENYNRSAVALWIQQCLKDNIFCTHPDYFIHTTPIEIEITKEITSQIKNVYNDYEETGGLIFCRASKIANQTKLIPELVCKIENIVELRKDTRYQKKNSYEPDPTEYKNLLCSNFSNTNLNDILIPIDFHCHPNKNLNKTFTPPQSFRNTYFQLDTSDGDQGVEKYYHLQFDNMKIGYFNAVISGHELFKTIVFYANHVTPLNFLSVKKQKIINDGEEKKSDNAKDSKDFPKLQKFIEKLIDYSTRISTEDENSISEVASFFEGEYFSMLNESESTIIHIPDKSKYQS